MEDLALQIQQLKDKYVGEDKPMSEEDFTKIQDVAGGKFYILAWLAKRVGIKMIKPEDIYKYKEYFEIFEKNKTKFTHKDINLYKTQEDLNLFLDEVFKIREGNIIFDETQGKDNFVTQNEIEKLQSTNGIKYLGIFDNENFKYQVFEVFGVDKETWKIYRDILGRCKGRSKGASIDICTIGDYSHFKNYLKSDKGSSYFLLYNLDDPRSPYQLHYESDQFMDKNDRENHKINRIKFYKFIGERVPRYNPENESFPGTIEIPVKDKGWEDDKGKQGLWKKIEKGKLDELTTYKNNKENGPYATFFKGKISSKGTKVTSKGYTFNVGDFEEFFMNGKIESKGTYDRDSKRIGIWYDGQNDGAYTLTDYSKYPTEISGFTKSGKLRYVGFGNPREKGLFASKPHGNITIFYPSGAVAAIGRLGKDNKKLGEWTTFFPDGKIKSQGKYSNGYRTGEWVDIIKATDGKKYILVTKFTDTAYYTEKIKVYNIEGEFIKEVKFQDIEPDEFWRHNDYIPLDSFK